MRLRRVGRGLVKGIQHLLVGVSRHGCRRWATVQDARVREAHITPWSNFCEFADLALHRHTVHPLPIVRVLLRYRKLLQEGLPLAIVVDAPNHSKSYLAQAVRNMEAEYQYRIRAGPRRSDRKKERA